MRFIPCGGRSVTGTPLQWLWIEIAASCACATAQMMFLGPNAASPPKNTPGRRRLHRHRIDDRHAVLVELDADVALDPRERVLLADRQDHVVAGMITVSILRDVWRPFASSRHSSRSNSMPMSLPLLRPRTAWARG